MCKIYLKSWFYVILHHLPTFFNKKNYPSKLKITLINLLVILYNILWFEQNWATIALNRPNCIFLSKNVHFRCRFFLSRPVISFSRSWTWFKSSLNLSINSLQCFTTDIFRDDYFLFHKMIAGRWTLLSTFVFNLSHELNHYTYSIQQYSVFFVFLGVQHVVTEIINKYNVI